MFRPKSLPAQSNRRVKLLLREARAKGWEVLGPMVEPGFVRCGPSRAPTATVTG